MGDRDELAQVFQNLVDNAIKYGRPGSAVRDRQRLASAAPSRRDGLRRAAAGRPWPSPSSTRARASPASTCRA